MLVFAQTDSLALAVEAWSAHAERFFRTKLGRLPEPDHVLVVERGQEPATVILHARAATERDRELAREAERHARGSGLAELARRCPTVLEVTGDHARGQMIVAGVLASIMLGPIVDTSEADRPMIFGVRGARERLER